MPSYQFANIGQATRHRGSGSHRGAEQVSTATPALASLKIPVRGRGTSFSGAQLVGIHAQTH